MSQVLRQAWWAPIAALLVVPQLVIAANSGSERGESWVAGLVIGLVGAAILAAGLWKRLHARGLGNLLIVVGSLFGAFWFWTGYTPVMALIVIIGVIVTEVRSPASAATTP